ncbi:Flp family type IVb pilin [bacterium]|nr:MAG: Flp family type IVb pilin [bacterium]
MKELLLSLLKDEDGQGMVEYGIIIALISVVAIVAVKSIGGKTNKAFQDVDKALTTK